MFTVDVYPTDKKHKTKTKTQENEHEVDDKNVESNEPKVYNTPESILNFEKSYQILSTDDRAAISAFRDKYPGRRRACAEHRLESLWKDAKGRGLPGEKELIATLEKYKKSPDWTKNGGEYIPNITRFIEEDYWKENPDADPTEKTTLTEADVRKMDYSDLVKLCYRYKIKDDIGEQRVYVCSDDRRQVIDMILAEMEKEAKEA